MKIKCILKVEVELNRSNSRPANVPWEPHGLRDEAGEKRTKTKNKKQKTGFIIGVNKELESAILMQI